jgi:SAM-dependent methyltransferase
VKLYMRHDWQGTVRRTSGYHYDAPPVVAETINPDILALIPTEARTVIEIGCGSGALARAYKKINPVCEWTGVEVDASRVAIARQPCDFVFHADIDSADDTIFSQMTYADCLVISLHIEKLANPWALLSRLRAAIPDHACLIVYFANMQHWSVQARLNQGLLDHSASSIDRRPQWWFTRSTMLSLLAATGFQVSAGSVKIGSADGAQYMPAIRHMATLSGIDPEVAAQDASAVQYIVRAVPIAA